MNIGYNHIRKGQAEDPNPLLLTVSNPTIACADVEVTIQEPVADIVEAGVIGYRTIVSNPDAVSYDDKVVIDTPVQGSNTIPGADLSLLSYDSITDTSTKNFYTYAYVKYSDGSYKYSDMQTNTFAPNTLSNNLEAYYSLDGNANDLSGNGNDGTLHGNVSFTGGLISDSANYPVGSTGNYIDTGFNFQGLDTFSVGIWVNPERLNTPSNPYYPGIITNSHGSGVTFNSPDRGIDIGLGTVDIYDSNTTGRASTDSFVRFQEVITQNEWQYITINYSPSEGLEAIRNGEVVANGIFGGVVNPNNNRPFRMGIPYEYDQNDHQYDGMLDEVIFHTNKITSLCEHKLLYRKGQGLPYA